jgi:uncharacterized membrane protein YdjX (TVP38/TMEM64 family)
MKWTLGLALALILGALWWSGALAELSDAEQLRELVAQAGLAGPIVFVGVVVLLFPLLLAGPAIWISGTIWPIPIAIVYAGVASTLASASFFGLARWLARDWASARIPDNVRKYEERLESHPVRTIVVLRALLWINPAVDILIGVSRVSIPTYLGASAAVLAPLTAMHVVFPAKGIEFASAAPDWLAPAAGVAAVAGVAIWLLRKRRVAVVE